ncbi:MAG TPA: GNAT family N-acetyltransferase [Phycisphaerae bacterium]|nr:GNAT family N-acetyltransferase [Phycisphaerae bacterium]
MHREAEVTIREITGGFVGTPEFLKQLTEISMKGNNYSLSDEVRWDATMSHFQREFSDFDGESNVFFVAEQGERVIGFTRGSIHPGRPGQWWLNGLEVREEHRGAGVGTRLTQARIEALSKRRITSIWARIAKSNLGSLIVAHKLGLRILTDRAETITGTYDDSGRSWFLRMNLPRV